jgi:hypothetical protein
MPEPKLAPTPTVWRDVSANVDVSSEIAKILDGLDDARKRFEEFEKEHPNTTEKRRKWMVEYNTDPNNVLSTGMEGHKRFVAEWKAREPGLVEVKEVTLARKRVADLEEELAKAKSELVEVEAQGSPVSQYIKALAKAETMLTSLGQTLWKQVRAKLMVEYLGHSDEWKLTEDAKTFINTQPSVMRAATFSYKGSVSGPHGSEALSPAQLKLAHMNVTDALSKLKEMTK